MFLEERSTIWIAIDAVIFIINGVAIFVMFVCKPTIWNRLQLKFFVVKRAGVNVLTFFINKKRGVMNNSLSNQQASSGSSNITVSDRI